MFKSSAVFVFLFLFFQGMGLDRAVYSRGEGREALVVQGMVQEGNYILPLRGGELPSKPPLFHWSSLLLEEIGGRLGIDGSSEYYLRLPSAVYAAAGAALFFGFALAKQGVFFAASVLLLAISSAAWVSSAGAARVDMCFCFFLIIQFISICNLLEGKRNWGIGVFVGCLGAVLAKGPTGVLLPIVFVLACMAYEWLEFGRREIKTGVLVLAVSMLATGAGTLWYAMAYSIHGDAFLQKQIIGENIERFSGGTQFVSGHSKPLWQVPFLFLGALLPWSAILVGYLVYLGIWKEDYSWRWLRENRLVYCLIWTGLFLLAVSVSSSKRSVYFLPVVLPACYILVFFVRARVNEASFRRLIYFPSSLLIAAFLIGRFIHPIVAEGRSAKSFVKSLAELPELICLHDSDIYPLYYYLVEEFSREVSLCGEVRKIKGSFFVDSRKIHVFKEAGVSYQVLKRSETLASKGRGRLLLARVKENR